MWWSDCEKGREKANSNSHPHPYPQPAPSLQNPTSGTKRKSRSKKGKGSGGKTAKSKSNPVGLQRSIGKMWRELGPRQRSRYDKMHEKDMERYRAEMAEATRLASKQAQAQPLG